MNMIFFILFFAFSSLGYLNYGYAAGIALGATRIIYLENMKQVNLPITNTHSSTSFLIQSWVTDPSGEKSNNFIITPPLFVLKPRGENTMRIIYTGTQLPIDRESVYYLNSKAIPSVKKDSLKGNNLQIATQSIIKVFMRPSGLKTSSLDSIDKVSCKVIGNTIKVDNPSPYFISIVMFFIGNEKINNFMIPPLSSHSITSKSIKDQKISFQMINDYGGTSKQHICPH